MKLQRRGMLGRLHRLVLVASTGMVAMVSSCTPLFEDYQTLFQSMGTAAIQIASDNVFANAGTDFNAVVVAPTTTFVQATWDNWIDNRIQDDLPNNPIVAR